MTEESEMITFDSPEEVRRKVFARFDNELARIRGESQEVEFDLSTAKGEAEARSYIHSIRTVKADVDRTRKEATAGFRKQVTIVNEAGNAIVGELDEIIDRLFAPLKAKAEALRQLDEKRERFLDGIRALVTDRDSGQRLIGSEKLRDALRIVEEKEIDPELMGNRTEEAEGLKARAVHRLREFIEEAEKREQQERELAELRRQQEEAAERERAQQAEIDRLKREAEARERAERERIEAEARAQREAEEEEARRQAAEQADQERREAAKAAEQDRKERRARAREGAMKAMVELGGISLPAAERLLVAIEQKRIPGVEFTP